MEHFSGRRHTWVILVLAVVVIVIGVLAAINNEQTMRGLSGG